jgi:hypothetical protein
MSGICYISSRQGAGASTCALDVKYISLLVSFALLFKGEMPWRMSSASEILLARKLWQKEMARLWR